MHSVAPRLRMVAGSGVDSSVRARRFSANPACIDMPGARDAEQLRLPAKLPMQVAVEFKAADCKSHLYQLNVFTLGSRYLETSI